MNRRTWPPFVGIGMLAAGAALATPETYVLDLPPKDMIAYRVEIQVPLAGALQLWADWSPHRVLSFRLERPDGRVGGRRSGPPPQSLSVEVDEETARLPGPWTLTIRGLPSAEATHGTLEIRLPETRAEAPPMPLADPEPAVVLPDRPWTRPRTAPRELPADRVWLFETTERFRRIVVDSEGGARDRYEWQQDFLRFIAGRRDLVQPEGPVLTAQSRDTLARIARGIRRVEELATSKDPLLSGPAPEDPIRQRVWVRLRNERLEPLERELDGLLQTIREKPPVEAGESDWLIRLLSCLTACERYFDQRVRLGEDQAANRELVGEQWDRILAAAAALESLAALEPSGD